MFSFLFCVWTMINGVCVFNVYQWHVIITVKIFNYIWIDNFKESEHISLTPPQHKFFSYSKVKYTTRRVNIFRYNFQKIRQNRMNTLNTDRLKSADRRPHVDLKITTQGVPYLLFDSRRIINNYLTRIFNVYLGGRYVLICEIDRSSIFHIWMRIRVSSLKMKSVLCVDRFP